MKNTSAPLSIERRHTEELIEDLCLALRDTGVRDYHLPNDDVAVRAVTNVQKIYAELLKREANIDSRISQLSKETSWQMESLLKECLAYPDTIPYVRESDGVRRKFRCRACQKREMPDWDGLALCSTCLSKAVESFENKVPVYDLLLFRTYNKSKWCKHADAETILMAFDDQDSLDYPWCQMCVTEELARRATLNDQDDR